MSSANQPLIVYVDVDDTFVRSFGTKRIPMKAVLDHVRQLHQGGAILYCWSSGGADYARQSAEEFGIADCFTAFLPKPHVMLDDQAVRDWRLCLEVNPGGIRHSNLDQYWEEIRGKSS